MLELTKVLSKFLPEFSGVGGLSDFQRYFVAYRSKVISEHIQSRLLAVYTFLDISCVFLVLLYYKMISKYFVDIFIDAFPYQHASTDLVCSNHLSYTHRYSNS